MAFWLSVLVVAVVFSLRGRGELVGNGVDLKRKEISEGRKGILLNQSSSLLIIMVALDYLVLLCH